MNCAEARQAILDADPADLEGRGEGSLARHLRDCSRCEDLARAVLVEERALAQGLAEAVAAPELDAILDQVLGSDPKPGVFRFRLRRLGLTLLPVAAAAAMAALFLGSDPQLPGDPYLLPEPSQGLDLDIPQGQNVAVLATKDPKITVLWFF